MTSVARLLTAVSVTNAFKRNICTCTLFQREIEIHHMTTIPLKYLLIKNLRKQASGPEALFSTYLDLLESNADQETHTEFRNTIMEPYLKTSCASVKHQPYIANIVPTPTNTVANLRGNTFVPANPDPSLYLQKNGICKNDIVSGRQNYSAMRKWKKIGRGPQAIKSVESCLLRLFSYNILAQNLIEMHSYLYKHHDKRTLKWEIRKELLVQEILEAQANVICLQEMQVQHLQEFVKPFEAIGYKYVYKKRTNDTLDGLLLMYQSDTFNLVEFAKVEFLQSGVEVLSRDNVAIIVKLSLKDSPQTQVVIATTHLLYNPKRNDVRLAQTQILMAELDRIAFIENSMEGPRYHPIIMAGDFNLQPKSGVYTFITQGSLQYQDKSRTLGPPDHNRLSNSLIPPHLYITDGCQHYYVLVKRLCNRGTGRVMIENSEKPQSNNTGQSSDRNQFRKAFVDIQTQQFQRIEVNGHYATFGSGQLTHPFRLQSVYTHKDTEGKDEATTHQNRWITVDYIFFSDIELIEKYTLPTQRECKTLSYIPNLGIGSDHLSLGATFILRKKKQQQRR